MYISADYEENSGDRDVVEELHRWGEDDLHKVDYVDTASSPAGSVSENPDCRACDLKREFNDRINASSAVIFVVGDKTAIRAAGSGCRWTIDGPGCSCTPYKHNSGGTKACKVSNVVEPGPHDDYGEVNSLSYLQHEFEQAKKKGKTIIIVYNSLYKQVKWLPAYMCDYESDARPFWKKDECGRKVGDYTCIKQALGYE